MSRDRLQSELRICKECFENRVRDASLETAHRLSARFALRQLLTEVDSAAGIAASLADRDHVQHLVEAAVAGETVDKATAQATNTAGTRVPSSAGRWSVRLAMWISPFSSRNEAVYSRGGVAPIGRISERDAGCCLSPPPPSPVVFVG